MSDADTTAARPQLETGFYFPSAVYSVKSPDYLATSNEVFTEYVEREKTARPQPNEVYPVYQTGNMIADPRMQELMQFIAATGWNILQSQGYAMDTLSVFFMELWGHEHHKYSSMDEHVHGLGAQLVGFYFLDCPEGSSHIAIHDPRPAKKQINLPEAEVGKPTYASAALNFKPEPGLLFFTNAWLPHSFTRNAADAPARFLHFTLGVRPAHTTKIEPAQ